MMPSGHKAFLVHNIRDVDLLLMHNRTFAAEYDFTFHNFHGHEETNVSVQNCPRRLVKEEDRDSCKGEAAWRQGDKRKGQGHG